MDFTFLNYFLNLRSLPPMEPWASGYQMHYYYGGYFLYSAVLKLAGVSSDVGYNLIVSLIPALYFAGLYAIFRTLLLSARFSIFAACFMVFASDPEMLLSVISKLKLDSHIFWASTRVYTSPGFTEYPFWTFLFADLHPHFMALPFVALFILFLFNFSKNGFGVKEQILTAMCLAFILLLNAWDGIACSLLLAFFWGISELLYKPSLKFPLRAGLFFIILCFFCLPVVHAMKTESNSLNLIWAITAEFNTLNSILRVLGVWLVPILFCLLISISARISVKSILLLVTLTIGLGGLVGFSQFYLKNDLPWQLLGFVYILLVGYSITKFSSSSIWPQLSIFAAFSLSFFIVVEFLVIIDRMNSVFKFHYFLWTCFAIQALFLIYQCHKKNKWFSLSLLAPVFLISILGSAASIGLCFTQGFHWNLTAVSKGLNGFKYFNDYNHNDAQIILWLRKNAKPDSVVVEAYGPSYQDYTRISTNTGLATVLGWDYHVSQRGIPPEAISKRKEAIKTIYQSHNVHSVCSLLKRYQVSYLVLGDLERSTYEVPAKSALETAPCLKIGFRVGNAYVAKVL